MKVICRNKDCSEFNKEVFYSSTSYRIISSGRCVSKDIECPVCKIEREELKIEHPDGFSCNFQKIGSMSPQERKKVLKKRSNEHYQKHIKEKKQYLDRKIFGKEN